MLVAIFILLLVVFFPGLILFGGGIAIILALICGLLVTIAVFIYIHDTGKKKRELKRIQKSETGEAIKGRLAEIKEPGQTVSLGGFTWKVVAVEGETALLICMEGRKISHYNIIWHNHKTGINKNNSLVRKDVAGRMEYEALGSVRYMENVLMGRISKEAREMLMDTPETWGYRSRSYEDKSGTRYFFLLNEREVEQYFHGVENMASFLEEKARPSLVSLRERGGFLLFKCIDTDYGSDAYFHPAMWVKLPK